MSGGRSIRFATHPIPQAIDRPPMNMNMKLAGKHLGPCPKGLK
jgi:hypothetical protein